MEKKERNISKNLLRGTLIAGAFLSVGSLNAAPVSNLFSYDVMGSGAEVRSEILNHAGSSAMNNFELNCGEKSTDSKAKEAKCGEGKCGDKKEAKTTC